MQSFDERDKLVRSGILEKYEELDREMNDQNVKHVTVGELPKKGDEVTINGLRYKAITGKNRIKKDRQLILELL